MPCMPEVCSVEIDGLTLNYRDWGGLGQPLVLLHGLASNCRIWDLVAPIMTPKYRVVAVDQRGHGKSSKPDYGYDFDSITNDLSAFISHMGFVRPIIIGHSWGASVALEYAATYSKTISGIVLVDGGTMELSSWSNMTLTRVKTDLAPPQFSGMTVDALKSRFKSSWVGSMWRHEIEEIRLSNFHIDEFGVVSPLLSRENHMRIITALWNHYPSALYSTISCPVLLMPAIQKSDLRNGKHRPDKREAIATALQLLCKGRSVWLEDSIHDVPLQRPELVARIITEHIQNGFLKEP